MATLTAKEAALKLDTDGRTFRKFMRSITPEDNQPGQGNRWSIEAKDMNRLKKQFAEWQAPKVAAVSTNGKGKSKGKAEEAIEIDADEDLDLTDLDEPDAEALDELEDADDVDEDDEVELVDED